MVFQLLVTARYHNNPLTGPVAHLSVFVFHSVSRFLLLLFFLFLCRDSPLTRRTLHHLRGGFESLLLKSFLVFFYFLLIFPLVAENLTAEGQLGCSSGFFGSACSIVRLFGWRSSNRNSESSKFYKESNKQMRLLVHLLRAPQKQKSDVLHNIKGSPFFEDQIFGLAEGRGGLPAGITRPLWTWVSSSRSWRPPDQLQTSG